MVRSSHIDLQRVHTFLERQAARMRRAAHGLSRVTRPGKARDNVWIGLECADAAAQDFCSLEARGYRVYRDFPGERFVIGHIAVGLKGVFSAGEERETAHETGKGASGDERAFFDSRFFRSPVRVAAASLAGARRQAAWLSWWLESGVGEAVAVYPLLVIAGWLANRGKWGDIVLVGQRDYETLTAQDAKGLSGTVIEKIQHRLDGRCSNRTPASRRPSSYHPAGVDAVLSMRGR